MEKGNSSGIHQKCIIFERFRRKHQKYWYCLILNTSGKKVFILWGLWIKSTLWTVRIVAWCGELKQNAPHRSGGLSRCACVCVHVTVNVCVCVCTCMWLGACVCACVCKCVYASVCMSVCDIIRLTNTVVQFTNLCSLTTFSPRSALTKFWRRICVHQLSSDVDFDVKPVARSIFEPLFQNHIQHIQFLKVSSRTKIQVLLYLISSWHYFVFVEWIHFSPN